MKRLQAKTDNYPSVNKIRRDAQLCLSARINKNMDKYQNKYRIPSARLPGYDYGAHGLYYVTICTKNRVHYFGNIVETHNCASPNVETDSYPFLRATEMGKTANEFWQEIPQHFPFVELDEFIIMPDHVHGILFLNKPNKTDWVTNEFGPQSQNLGSVIRGFKSSVKRHANENNIKFDWQSRFHDRIIRDENGLNNVRKYIRNNPKNWMKDVKTHNCASQTKNH